MPTNLETSYKLDVTQYLSAGQQIVQAMGGQAAATEKLMQTTEKFNDEFKQIGATVSSQVGAIQKITREYKALTQAQQEAIATGGKVPNQLPGTNLALSSAKVTTKVVPELDPTQVAAGLSAREQLKQLFPAPTNATIGQMGKYESALSRVQKLVESGKVSSGRFNEILNNVKTGDSLSKLKLTGDEAKLATAIGNIKDNFTNAQKAADSFFLSKENAFRITQALLLKEAIGAVVGQLQKAALEAVAFQIKISEIRTLSTENQSSFEAWSKSIERVSNAFGIPQVEVAKAAYEALSAQVTRSKDGTEQFLTAAANLARVGVADIGEAGKLLASVFNAYNISAERAEEVSAKLFVAIDRGNFTAKDLAGNFGRVETTAATLGVTFDELLAAMTTLTRQGVNSSDAQTQLSNVFLKLLNPSERAAKIMRSWGFESGQAAIAGLGFVGVLQKIEAATKGDAAALAEFGGEMRSIRGLIGLTTRGKGEEFQQDLAEIKNDAKKRFDQAKQIRGESAGDQLTIEANKIKNFFTNDLGQNALNSLNSLVKDFGHLNDVIRIGTTVLLDIVKVWGVYKISTVAASIAQGGFNTALNVFNTKSGLESVSVMQRNQKVAAAFGSVITGVGIAIAAAFAIDEIAKWRREIDGVNKKSEDYENTLKRIVSLREGKTETGESVGQKVFQENALKQSEQFGNFVDKLFQSLAKEQSDSAIAATRDLDFLKEKGKETALQLTEAFKRTGDSVHGLIKQHEEAFSKARAEVDKSKKAVLGYAETVKGLKFDLDFEFANDANNFQKFQLRDQKIREMTEEAKKLLSSNKNEDIDKGRQLANEVLRTVKEDEVERVRLQVEQDKARRQAQGGPRPGESPFVFANTADSKRRLDEFAGLFQQLEDNIQRRKQDEENQNTKLINQEKDRLRQLEDRVKLFNQLKLFEDNGKLNPEFATPEGKLDENKFNKTFDERSKAITSLLKTEEEKAALLPQLEKARVALLQQQTAEIRLQTILTKQLEAGNIQKTAKDEFERATKKKIEASATAEQAGKELGSASDIIRGFLDRTRTDEKFSTIGEDGNLAQRSFTKVIKVINDLIDSGIKATGREPLPLTQREAIKQQNEGLIKSIVETQAEIDKNRDALLQRDKEGNLVNNPQAVQNLRGLNDSLISKLNLLLSKFTGSSNNTDIATPGGATLGELRNQLNQALDLFIKSRQQANDADKIQKNLEDSLSKIFTPAQIEAAKNTAATTTLTGATLRAATATENLVLQFKNLPQLAPPATPSNVPLTMPGGKGFHDGGLIKGPQGYDNLLIRAEANEFIVNANATKKWLPELIAMNAGRSPKMKGKYHEGGLVQTNVGDVNVTISGPVSPERNVRQIGKAIRRQIRQGVLDLSSGR
jgi:TP901 family phage tail tape measure protein